MTRKEELQGLIRTVKEEIEWFEPSDYLSPDDFDSYLDECEPTVEMMGMSYLPSFALKNLDPIAYHCAYADWCSAADLEAFTEYRELQDHLEGLQQELEDLNED